MPSSRTSAPSAIIALRGLTGFALACVYPPGENRCRMVPRPPRTALGIVVRHSPSAQRFICWRGRARRAPTWADVVSSLLAVAGGCVVWLMVEDGPYVSATAPFNPRRPGGGAKSRRSAGDPQVLGHMWELYAMDLDFSVRGRGPAGAVRHQPDRLADCVYRDRKRCGWLRRGRALGCALGKRSPTGAPPARGLRLRPGSLARRRSCSSCSRQSGVLGRC
jgi:hypothetical protein